MVEFVHRMEMVFIATADAGGDCDASLRAGSPGFLRVLDDRTLAYPEYRGNGVHASLGNISENGHVGILMVDFVRDMIGLHVNGTAEIVEDPDEQIDTAPGRRVRLWVVTRVQEAYIHCAKHIPRMAKIPRQGPSTKKSEYFVPGTPEPDAATRSRSDEAPRPA